jgi:cell wall assembly regulator SMI1
MTSPRERLEQAAAVRFFDIDEKPLELTLLPGLDSDEVRKLETELGAPLPRDIDELVRHASGFEFGPVETVAFDAGFSFGMEDILPRAMPLCADGFGNLWVVEVQPSGAWGPIFFACHDPPVLIVQATDIGAFIDGILSLGRKGRTSAVTEVRDAAPLRIWREDPWGIPASRLRDSTDATLRGFAAELKADDIVFDLREQHVGSGFAWGRHGSNGGCKRCRDDLVFAVLMPSKKPGFFQRAFGR